MPEGFSPKDEENVFDISVWLAGDDNDKEGKFCNWYTNEALTFLPWGKPPFKGSTSYNWMRTHVIAIKNGTKITTKEAGIYNARAVHESLPLCTIDSKVLRIKLRGLCKDFSFDREYFYTVNEFTKEDLHLFFFTIPQPVCGFFTKGILSPWIPPFQI